MRCSLSMVLIKMIAFSHFLMRDSTVQCTAKFKNGKRAKLIEISVAFAGGD